MKRLLLFFAALFMTTTFCLADEGDGEEPLVVPIVDVGEVIMNHDYVTTPFNGFAAVLHVKESGLLSVMSSNSDYPKPYADADHTVLLDYLASFYEGKQGYVINVAEGDVIYFYNSFCMDVSKVWFEMQKAELTFTSAPEVGGRLVPTGRAQLELMFNMPVATSGGTMKCAGQTVQLEAHSGNLYFIYEIKEIIMRWIDLGIPAGTPIDVELHDVHAVISESVKYGTNGTLRLRYQMPSAPGMLVGTNFEDRSFKSYWLPDDEEGVFRMTFSRPVNVKNPGYINIVYGSAEAMDVNSIVYDGVADGNDIVFDFRDVLRRPADLLESKSTYPTITLHPGGVRDENGDLMYSPGIGTLASWTYEIPYVYLYGTPRWEVTDESEDDIEELQGGDGVLLYVYNYHVVKADGICLTFDDGTEVIVPMSDVEVNYESNLTTAELFFTVPYVGGRHDEVTISFANLRLTTGEKAPVMKETYDWINSTTTGVASATAADDAAPVYDLAGRRVHQPAVQRISVKEGRKVIR